MGHGNPGSNLESLCRLGLNGAGCGPAAGCCEHGNEPSGSVKDEGISGVVEILKKDPASRSHDVRRN
jgi:hypothetical protein